MKPIQTRILGADPRITVTIPRVSKKFEEDPLRATHLANVRYAKQGARRITLVKNGKDWEIDA